MQHEASSFSSIGSISVQYDKKHVNIGPAPDLILVHFRAVSAQTTGPFLEAACLTDGYEEAEFRADGIVTYRATYLLDFDGFDPLLLRYSGMSDVGEEAYEQMLDDHLPGAVRLDASARFFTRRSDIAGSVGFSAMLVANGTFAARSASANFSRVSTRRSALMHPDP